MTLEMKDNKKVGTETWVLGVLFLFHQLRVVVSFPLG